MKMRELSINKNYFMSVFIVLMLLILFHDAIMQFLSSFETLFRPNNREILELTSYKERVSDLEKQLFEYEKSLNNLSIYKGSSYVLARASLRDIYDVFNSITISADNKVSVGSAVVNEDGLVGIIKSTSGLTAKVNLITSKNKLSVRINNSYGLTNGYDSNNNLILVKNVSNYSKISIGDEVLTSGFTDVKKDLKIGVVEDIREKGIEMEVYVKPYVDFNNLNYLYVIEV